MQAECSTQELRKQMSQDTEPSVQDDMQRGPVSSVVSWEGTVTEEAPTGVLAARQSSSEARPADCHFEQPDCGVADGFRDGSVREMEGSFLQTSYEMDPPKPPKICIRDAHVPRASPMPVPCLARPPSSVSTPPVASSASSLQVHGTPSRHPNHRIVLPMSPSSASSDSIAPQQNHAAPLGEPQQTPVQVQQPMFLSEVDSLQPDLAQLAWNTDPSKQHLQARNGAVGVGFDPFGCDTLFGIESGDTGMCTQILDSSGRFQVSGESTDTHDLWSASSQTADLGTAMYDPPPPTTSTSQQSFFSSSAGSLLDLEGPVENPIPPLVCDVDPFLDLFDVPAPGSQPQPHADGDVGDSLAKALGMKS